MVAENCFISFGIRRWEPSLSYLIPDIWFFIRFDHLGGEFILFINPSHGLKAKFISFGYGVYSVELVTGYSLRLDTHLATLIACYVNSIVI